MFTVKVRLLAAAGVVGLLGTTGCAQPPAGAEDALALVQPAVAPAAVGACSASPSAPNIGDIDGDGVADPVVTSFYSEDGHFSESGYLEIRNSTAGVQSIDLSDFSIQGMPGVVVGDITGDGCADVVGSYYYQSDTTALEQGLFTIQGSSSGLVTSTLKKYKNITGDIALLTKPKALVVSSGAAVKLYPLDAKGVPGKGTVILKVATGAEAVGSIEAIAASGNRLVLGMQSKKVGRTRDAGMVYVLTFSGKGLKYHKLTLTQNTRGFSTAAEFNDRFGFSVATRGNLVAIGTPYETIGKAKQTGMVQVVKLTTGDKPKVKKVYNLTRNSPGIPGSNASGDHWGYSVNLAAGIGCTSVSVLASAPFKTVAGTTRAGTVTVAGLGKACGATWSRAVAPFSGVVETEGFGTEISVLTGTAGGSDTVLLNTSGGYQYSQVFQVKNGPAGTSTVEELLPLNGEKPPLTQLGIALRN